jgi:hypothetical protein
MIEPIVREVAWGNYVRYEDYARLKAECQARQAENSVLAVECDSLKAEVERLTNAGDCLVIHLEACYRAEGYDPKDCDMIDNWNAAKKGAAS